MAQTTANVNRLYRQDSLPEDREISIGNGSYYNDQLKQTGYHNLLLNFTYSVVNESLPTFPAESNISTESYITAQDTNGSNSFFPIAILLQESWWNVFDEKYLRHSWNWTITLITAYMFILVAGVIGNCMVILVVLLRPQMRTVTNMFIMNLAVADLFVIIFCVGPTLLANIFLPWMLGSFMCKCVPYIQGVAVCASAYSLVAISLDRCYAVYRPLDRYRGISKSQALKTMSLIWILALSLTLPWAVIFNIVISDNNGLASCQETWETEHHGNLYFLIANPTLCYSLPLVTIAVSNAVVWRNVKNRNVPIESASAAILVKRVHQRARENVRKMLSIVTLTFLISWLPLYILVTRLKFATDMSESEQDLIDMLMPFAQWLGSSNSCINPILYAFLNKKFRQEFYSILRSWVRFLCKNNIMGMGKECYGMSLSTQNVSGTCRHPRSRIPTCQNSNRTHKRHQRSSTVRLSSFRHTTERICATRLFTTTVDMKHNFATVNITDSVVKASSYSETITDL